MILLTQPLRCVLEVTRGRFLKVFFFNPEIYFSKTRSPGLVEKTDSYLSKWHLREVKRKRLHSGFELGSLRPFPEVIHVRPRPSKITCDD